MLVPFPSLTAAERSAPGGSEPRRALPEQRVPLPGPAHRPRRAGLGKGPGSGGCASPQPHARGSVPHAAPTIRGARAAGAERRYRGTGARSQWKHRQEKEEKEGMDHRAGEQ